MKKSRILTWKHLNSVAPVIGKPVKNAVRNSKNAVKNMILHSTMFEDLGFHYIGPIDGHNLEELEQGLMAAKAVNKPVFKTDSLLVCSCFQLLNITVHSVHSNF